MLNKKKIACASLALVMIASCAGCAGGKLGGSKIKKDDVVEHAEDAIDTILELKEKSLKKLGDIDEDYLSLHSYLEDDDASKIVFEHAVVEVDEDSVETEKDSASVDVTIKLPDYEDAYNNSWDIDEFEEIIEDQKEKEYNKIEVTLEFEIDDDEWTLDNLDDVWEGIFSDYFCYMTDQDSLKDVIEAYKAYFG